MKKAGFSHPFEMGIIRKGKARPHLAEAVFFIYILYLSLIFINLVIYAHKKAI